MFVLNLYTMLNSLVIEHYQWIMQSAFKYFRNKMDAEDLAEETILKILTNKHNYDGNKPFKPWCSVIMLNTYITAYNHDSLIRFDDEDKAKNEVSLFDTEQQVRLSEMLGIIDTCRLKSCSVDCVMMYADGYSYDEIACSMSIPVGTVRSRISYGRDMLRKYIDYHKVK